MPTFRSLHLSVRQNVIAEFLTLEDMVFLLTASTQHQTIQGEITFRQIALQFLLLRNYTNPRLKGAQHVIRAFSLSDLHAFPPDKRFVDPTILFYGLFFRDSARTLALLNIVKLRETQSVTLTEELLGHILRKDDVVLHIESRPADIRFNTPTNKTIYSMLLDIMQEQIRNVQEKKANEILESGSSEREFCTLALSVIYSILFINFLTLVATQYPKNSSDAGLYLFILIFLAIVPSACACYSIPIIGCQDNGRSKYSLPQYLSIVLCGTIFATPLTLIYTIYLIYANCRISYINNTIPHELLPEFRQLVRNTNKLNAQASTAEYQRAANLGLPTDILENIQAQPPAQLFWIKRPNSITIATSQHSYWHAVDNRIEETNAPFNHFNNIV